MMTDWQERFALRICTPEQAVADVRSGQRVFIGSGCAEPQRLVSALAARGGALADTQIVHIMTLGTAPYVETRFTEQFRHNAFFIGPNVRDAVAQGRADYTPIFLSEIPRLFRRGRLPIDAALIQVSPPDDHGFCSYGVSVDVVKAAAECARVVAAEVNPRTPRTLGDSFIHIERIHRLVPVDDPILESVHPPPDDVARRIGRHIAGLIEDGATLQTGIGTIPDAVLAALTDRRDLGIHTEMFSDGVIDLVTSGVITGARKRIHTGKIVASFVIGTKRLYDFIDDNPMVEFHPTEYVNDPYLIARHDRMAAINSALQVDLTGQICADSLGTYFYSGIGGQVDFIRGASRSEGGKPIIALPSTAQDGRQSRITPTLSPGAGVVTSRGDVHYVVTEYGVADLHGKTIRERAMALVHVAHPKFRERLMEEAHERHFVRKTQVAVLYAGAAELDAMEEDVTLADGTRLHLRPIRPTDEDLMRDMFYGLSPDTIYHRFFQALKSMPADKLEAFVNIDYATEMALVAVSAREEGEQIVGVARYVVDMATHAAETAFVMRDDWQGRGLGIAMFRRLVEIARGRGIVRFTAEVLADNAAMVRLFHHCATGPVRTQLEADVYHLSFELPPDAAGAGERDAGPVYP